MYTCITLGSLGASASTPLATDVDGEADDSNSIKHSNIIVTTIATFAVIVSATVATIATVIVSITAMNTVIVIIIVILVMIKIRAVQG
jgi:hypothetical protein